LREEESGAGEGVACDGLLGLGAVGEAGRVAEVKIACAGDKWQQGAQDSETTEAGVEDGDCGGVVGAQRGLPSGERIWMDFVGSATP
jgi:hypothetical protein